MKKTLLLLALLATLPWLIILVRTQERPVETLPPASWIPIENQTLDAIVKKLASKVGSVVTSDQNLMRQRDREMLMDMDSVNALERQNLFTLKVQLQNAQYQQFLAESDKNRISTELELKRDSLEQHATALQNLEATSLKLKELWKSAECDLNLVYSQYHDYYLLYAYARIPDKDRLSDRQIAEDLRPHVFYYAKQTAKDRLKKAVKNFRSNPLSNSNAITVQAINEPLVWWSSVDSTCARVFFAVSVTPLWAELAERDDKPPKVAEWISKAAVHLIFPNEEVLEKGARPSQEGPHAAEAEKDLAKRLKEDEEKIPDTILSPLKKYVSGLVSIVDRDAWDQRLRECDKRVREAEVGCGKLRKEIETFKIEQKSLDKEAANLENQSARTNEDLVKANNSLEQAEKKWAEYFGNCQISYYPGNVRDMTFESSFGASSQGSTESSLRELYKRAVEACRNYFVTPITAYVEAESLRTVPGMDRKANAWEKPSDARIAYASTPDKKKAVIALALKVKYLIPEKHILKINFIPRDVLRQKAIINGVGDTVSVTYKSLIYRSLNTGRHGEGYKGVEEMIRKANAGRLGNRQNWRLPAPEELAAIHYYAENMDEKQPNTLFEELGIVKGRLYWTEEEVGNSFDRKFITVEFGKQAYKRPRPSSSAAHCIVVAENANAEVKK